MFVGYQTREHERQFPTASDKSTGSFIVQCEVIRDQEKASGEQQWELGIIEC